MIGEGLFSSVVPDCLWPTDNEYDIPILNSSYQADAVDLPVTMWGTGGRIARMHGTWGFYVDDYRFSVLWKSPHKVLTSGCVNCIEPNFTVTNQSPFSAALWHTYKKRWIARYWQEHGNKKIFVDLNVGKRYAELNLVGVPLGWRAYATRGYDDRADDLLFEYELAVQHRGNGDVLFLVYGGGKRVQSMCRQFDTVIWIPDYKTAVREERKSNG